MSDFRRFSGVDRLYGERSLSVFSISHVVIVGIGGVGSWAVEALARTGVGKMTLIDLDMIAESNTNRQLHALGSHYGQAKVDAMAERVRQINPACDVVTIEDFITPENVGDLIGNSPSFVADAIDQTRAKVAIADWCRMEEVPLVMAGAAGGRRDPTLIRVGDLATTLGDSLLSRVRQQLRKLHDFPREPGQKFGIKAVYSEEKSSSAGPTPTGGHGLSCTGYGSSACVTGAFGLAVSSVILNELSRSA